MHHRASIVHVAATVLGVLALAEAAQVYVGMSLMGTPVPWWWALRATGPSWLVLFVLVVPLLWWLDGRPSRVTHPRRIAFHAMVGLAFVTVHLGGSAALGEVFATEPVGFLGRVYELASVYFVLDLLTYVAVVGAHYAVRRDQEDARRDVQAARILADASEARLMALEGQLRPDFFFNTLNAVSGLLARGDSAGGARALTSLGALVRTSLAEPSRDVPLEEEMALVADYLSLQELRFPDRLRSTWRVDGDAARLAFPPLLLMQLVEALVDRGLSSGRPFFLDVDARSTEGGVEIALSHSAPPLDHDGVLRLVSRRLATFEPSGDLVHRSRGELSLCFGRASDGRSA